MRLAPRPRKLVLATHLVVAVGWIGAALAYLSVAVAAQASDDPAIIRSAWISMEVMGWYVIVPLAVTSLITGIVMSVGTRWGLIRHYWVLFSLVLTTFATVVSIAHMPSVSSNADMVRASTDAHIASMGGDIFHPAVGVVLLIVAHILNVFKPRGLTPYGLRAETANLGAPRERV